MLLTGAVLAQQANAQTDTSRRKPVPNDTIWRNPSKDTAWKTKPRRDTLNVQHSNGISMNVQTNAVFFTNNGTTEAILERQQAMIRRFRG